MPAKESAQTVQAEVKKEREYWFRSLTVLGVFLFALPIILEIVVNIISGYYDFDPGPTGWLLMGLSSGGGVVLVFVGARRFDYELHSKD